MDIKAEIANVRQIIGEIQNARRGAVPVARDAFALLSERMNNIVVRVNEECDSSLHPRLVTEADLSFSGAFARPEAMDALETAAKVLLEFLEGRMGAEACAFRCFKVDAPCPKKITAHRFKFFIATSFSEEYKKITTDFIERMERDFNIPNERIFRADNYVATWDIMCKICQGLQESDCVIANISGFNPNVMLELGMALGLCKEIILLKDSRIADQEVSDIKGLEYIAYSSDDEWYERMKCILNGKNLV